MLKIKDSVDLKELEKFGFKPKYNEDTGELDRYIKVVKTDHNHFYYTVEAVEKWIDESDFFKPEKRNPFYKQLSMNYCIATSGQDRELLKQLENVLYDLIKADMVEKVSE